MIFVDSYFYIAFLNERDPDHARVVAASRSIRERLLTTEFVLVEVANALAGTSFRKRVVDFLTTIERQPWITVAWSNRTVLRAGLDLYANRPDKEWSLTDCVSFVTMKEAQVTDALTHDHHFSQAGFRVLL